MSKVLNLNRANNMITIDFNVPILNLEGTPVRDQNGIGLVLGETLAEAFGANLKVNPMKFIPWALSMRARNPITVDRADFKQIKDFVNESEQMSALFKYRVLSTMEDAEEKSKDTK